MFSVLESPNNKIQFTKKFIEEDIKNNLTLKLAIKISAINKAYLNKIHII